MENEEEKQDSKKINNSKENKAYEVKMKFKKL